MLYRAQAPANIALLKYWGKKTMIDALPWPASPSLSMTLSSSVSICELGKRELGEGDEIVLSEISGSHAVERIQQHIDFLFQELGVERFPLYVRAYNTFPADCGLASSASGFAALTLAVVGVLLEASSMKDLAERGYHPYRLAQLAMRGSGSAARSFWGGYVSWLPGKSAYEQVLAPEQELGFFDLADTILVLSSAPKEVSSREGHRRASSSPLYTSRIAHAPERLKLMQQALSEQDFSTLGYLSEVDACAMHSVAMTSEPPICYWNESTQKALKWLYDRRRYGVMEVYATLDAGANVHVLSSLEDQDRLVELVSEELPLEKVICDRTGPGPTLECVEEEVEEEEEED